MGSIEYTDNIETVTPEMLSGFFVGWPNPPSSKTHLQILRRSYAVILAFDTEKNRVVGFINAVSDGLLSAYIPLLEVLPEFQRRGIGSGLLVRMLNKLHDFYMVDLTCDPTLQRYYGKLGMSPATGMMIRNYSAQAGRL
jgi:ribosomal protein S18 acetylase RimI-like enzyme